MVTAGLPTNTDAGVMVARTGETVIGYELDSGAPGLTTLRWNLPEEVLKSGVIAAFSWVELTKIVLKGFPDQSTKAWSINPLPLTVTRKYGPPASMRLGEALVMIGGGESAARAIAQRTTQKQRKCGLMRLK
jgi:hypothetical protein